MKSYINPQPQAVNRINHTELNPPANACDKALKENESDEEIYTNEAEEQAWEDVLKKDKLFGRM